MKLTNDFSRSSGLTRRPVTWLLQTIGLVMLTTMLLPTTQASAQNYDQGTATEEWYDVTDWFDGDDHDQADYDYDSSYDSSYDSDYETYDSSYSDDYQGYHTGYGSHSDTLDQYDNYSDDGYQNDRGYDSDHYYTNDWYERQSDFDSWYDF